MTAIAYDAIADWYAKEGGAGTWVIKKLFAPP